MTTKAKKEKRKQKKIKEKQKHKSNSTLRWQSGKLIRENANGDKYSKKYTIMLRDRLVDSIVSNLKDTACVVNPLLFYHRFLQSKTYIRDLLVYWSKDVEKEDYKYQFLKNCYEIYQDTYGEIIESELMELIKNEKEKLWIKKDIQNC